MAGPLLLSDNLYNTVAYPSHVITADEQATGHEIQNIADGRRSQYDYYTSVTANAERTLKVQCNIPRSVNTLFLDRGHNLTDKTIAYEHSANGSSWTTAWTFAPTGSGMDLRTGNFCLQSEALNTSPWGSGDLTMANNAIPAPNGTVTGSSAIPTAVSTSNHFVSQTISTTASEKIAISGYFKANGYTGIRLLGADVGGNQIGWALDLTGAGAVGNSVSTGTGVNGNATITADVGGWYSVTITGTVGTATSLLWYCQVFQNIAGANSGGAYSGNGSSGIYIWGAQFERNGSTLAAAKGYTKTVAVACAGAATEDGAWGYTFTAASNLYHRIRIPAMGTGLVPVVVGAWLGTAYQPSFFYNPMSDDGATFTRPGNTTEWGWRGGGPPVVTRDGTLNIRFDSAADYTTARPFLVKQFAAGRPMWICHDQAQADRTILAMFPDGARIDPRFDSGWFPRQVQIPYAEHEPRRQ